MMKKILKFFMNRYLRDSDIFWVVNPYGELGVRIAGRNFYMYKGKSLEYNDGSTPEYRLVGKREFGEVCKSPVWKNCDGTQYDDEHKRFLDSPDFKHEWNY